MKKSKTNSSHQHFQPVQRYNSLEEYLDTKLRGVFFDLFETLVTPGNLTRKLLFENLHKALESEGLKVGIQEMERSYSKVYDRFHSVRYTELREVGNDVWVSEALTLLGYHYSPNDPLIIRIVDNQFKPFFPYMRLIPGADSILDTVSKKYKIGLVSNFTYAPFVHMILAKLGIDHYFDTKIISHEVGIRKPHSLIFQTALDRLGLKAKDTVMIGDNPYDDILGANKLGMHTILIYTSEHSRVQLPKLDPKQLPDIIVSELKDLELLLLNGRVAAKG